MRWDERTTRLSSILQAISAIGYRAQPYDRARQEAASEKIAQDRLVTAVGGRAVDDAGDDVHRAGLSIGFGRHCTAMDELAQLGHVFDDLARRHLGELAILRIQLARSEARPGRHGFTGQHRRAVRLRRQHAEPAARPARVYFDSVSMFVFLLLSGRYLEERARRRAGAALEQLAGLLPAFAHRVLPDQTTEEVAVIHLQMGDTVLVKPGETIPVDGEILSGASEVDEALLTGESQPLAKHLGDSVTAGTVNHGSPLQISASRVGQSTRLSGIVRLLDRALAEKPRAALLADRIAGVFVAALLLVAAGTWWYWHGHNPAHALPITIAVLVISCPCALSLATPAALTAATGQLARRGMLIARGHTLDALANITDVSSTRPAR